VPGGKKHLLQNVCYIFRFAVLDMIDKDLGLPLSCLFAVEKVDELEQSLYVRVGVDKHDVIDVRNINDHSGCCKEGRNELHDLRRLTVHDRHDTYDRFAFDLNGIGVSSDCHLRRFFGDIAYWHDPVKTAFFHNAHTVESQDDFHDGQHLVALDRGNGTERDPSLYPLVNDVINPQDLAENGLDNLVHISVIKGKADGARRPYTALPRLRGCFRRRRGRIRRWLDLSSITGRLPLFFHVLVLRRWGYSG